MGAILAKVELIEEQIHQLPVELRQDRLSQLRQLAEKEFRLALYMFFKPILEDVDLDRRTRDEFQERLSLLQDFLYVAMIKQKGADLSLLLLQQIASRA